jgi:hypothetical protein
MPRHRSHNDVWALKIKAVLNPNEDLAEDDGERVLTFPIQAYEHAAYVGSTAS